MAALNRRDDMHSLPVGMRHSLLAIAVVSLGLSAAYFFAPAAMLAKSAALRPAVTLGVDVLSVGFVLIGIALIFAWKTGYGVVLALRAHSVYFGFWAVMFMFAARYYGAIWTAVPVYFGLMTWSMLCVATVKQWRRIGKSDK